MKKSLIFCMCFITALLGACGSYQFKPTTSYELADFNVTNHRGEAVSLQTLEGKPWFAMFIFTNCTTICTPMTYNMKLLQDELEKREITEYNIVAFSVDPSRDSQQVLSEYLGRYKVADEAKWHLLTDYSQEWIEQYAYNNFKTLVKMPQEGDQILHGSTFYLIDTDGVAVKNYDGYSQKKDGVPFETMAIDMETLLEEKKE